MRSTAFSNCHVPLFGENTSWYKSVKTPPYIVHAVSLHLFMQDLSAWRLVRTVSTTPAITITKLKDCCVARATFSRPLKSPHAYRPSSDKTVTLLLLGLRPSPKLPWVAYSLVNAEQDRREAGAPIEARGRARRAWWFMATGCVMNPRSNRQIVRQVSDNDSSSRAGKVTVRYICRWAMLHRRVGVRRRIQITGT